MALKIISGGLKIVTPAIDNEEELNLNPPAKLGGLKVLSGGPKPFSTPASIPQLQNPTPNLSDEPLKGAQMLYPQMTDKNVSKVFRNPEEETGRFANALAIARANKIPVSDASKVMPLMKPQVQRENAKKVFGLNREPTLTEVADKAALPIMVGAAIANPATIVPAVVGLGAGSVTKMATDKLRSYIPPDAPALLQNAAEGAGDLASLAVGAKAFKTAPEALSKLNTKLTKTSSEVTVPEQNISLSRDQVADIYKTGKLTTAEQQDLYTTLDLNRTDRLGAVKKGLDITIPAKTFKIIQDKPYWSKVKGIFGKQAFSDATPIGEAQKPTFTIPEGVSVKGVQSPLEGQTTKVGVTGVKSVTELPMRQSGRLQAPSEPRIPPLGTMSTLLTGSASSPILSAPKAQTPSGSGTPLETQKENAVNQSSIPEFTGNKHTDEYAKQIASNPNEVQALEDHVTAMKDKRLKLQIEDNADTNINPAREKELSRLSNQISLANDVLKVVRQPLSESVNLLQPTTPAVTIDQPNTGQEPLRLGAPKTTENISGNSSTDAPLPNKGPVTPGELKAKIEQLNKFAQGQSILRKGANLTTAAGQFIPIPDKGEVKITQAALKDDRVYMAVLSHELGHAIEYHVVGKINHPGLPLFGSSNAKDMTTLYTELRAITEELAPGGLAGKLSVGTKYGANYYNKPTELIARFFEKMLVSPGNLEAMAPTAMQLLEKQAIKHPIIAEFLEAAAGTIDKGQLSHVFMRDLKETYQKYLGKRAGTREYADMMIHKALVERGKIVFQKFLAEKFKGIKDSPETLFRSAESIKETKGGVVEYGTRKYSVAKTPEEEKALQDIGMTKTPLPVVIDGIAYPQYEQWIYTPAQAKGYFDSLSPAGQKLIKDFTAVRAEAQDFFNREMIKETYKIQGNIEGWVHHYFEGGQQSSPVLGGPRYKNRVAGSRKKRTGKAGYVEDFQKAMYKALVDLEAEAQWNTFIKRSFARVTKPLADGQKPDAGWVEVQGDLQSGVGLAQEKNLKIIQDGQSFKPRYTKYQMPKGIYEHYKLLKGLVDEASTAMKIVNDINRYWRINILAHPATTATNFISGGVQYSAKMLNDFYTEVLSGQASMPKTRRNVSAMVKVLTPKGWNSAPDWVYGGDLSNFYGQFTDKSTAISGPIDAYADKALKAFGLVERYWKKVIVLSENTRDLNSLNTMTKEGLRLPTEEERQMLAALESVTDMYAYNYNNVAPQIEAWKRNAAGNAVKPFITYPYKYMKQWTGMIAKAFDQTVTWRERVATLMALGTIVAGYAYYSSQQKNKQKTPEANKSLDIPARLQTRGRVFTGNTDEHGKELFVRVAKYPFLNLSEAGMQAVNGNWEGAKDVVSDMLGSVGPVGQVGLLAFNFRNKYQQYTPVPVILGDNLASFMPLGRILEDVSKYFDPYQRKQETFGQSFTKMIPTTDTALQEKLHGKVRTERVPVENHLNKVETQFGTYKAKDTRTTIDVPLENYKQDVLLALLSGVYVTRLDPKIVEAYITRKEKNVEKAAKKQGRLQDPNE
jgi:hypothetical protein